MSLALGFGPVSSYTTSFEWMQAASWNSYDVLYLNCKIIPIFQIIVQYATQAKSKSQVPKKKESYENWSDLEIYSLGKLSNEKNQGRCYPVTWG